MTSSDADAPDAAELGAVVLPEVTVQWPDGVAEPLGELARPVTELDALADALATMFPEAGPGSLLPDGVRWSRRHGWQLLITPRYDTTGAHYVAAGAFDEPAFGGAWRRDLQSVAIALTEAAFGRRPADRAEIRRLADVAAGQVPHGFDALVNLLLSPHARPGDTAPLRALAEALARRPAGPVTARCYVETGVGSAKARGRGADDNEDVTASAPGADGGVRLALFDGATGDGDGSGRTAALTARDSVLTSWSAGDAVPAKLLASAEPAVCEATADGCTTAVLVTVGPSGTAQLGSLGDSAAWLVRPDRSGHHVAWRLTPSHTSFALAVRAAAGPAGGWSELTHYLGGGAGDPFTTEFEVCPGDLLVLVSDGASVAQRNEWFGDTLRQLATARAGDDRPLGATVAAALVARAESEGGFDNATALIAEFTQD